MRVSVIIPTYNRRVLLGEALRSVLAQSRPPEEVLVVDDGSTDETANDLQSMGSLVRVFRQDNRGAAAARNLGLSHASCEWVAFLDSDDLWAPTKLEQQLQSLKHQPECRWSICDSRPIDIDGRALPGHHRPIQGGDITAALFRHVFVHTPAVLANKGLLQELGGFDPGLRVAEDYDLWLRASRRSRVAAVLEPLLLRRVHAQSLAHTDDPRNLDDKFAVLERFAADPGNRAKLGSRLCKTRLARAAFQAARAHLRHGNAETARNYLERAVSFTPWNLRLRVWLSRARSSA